jgi:myo-inositol 2-dehydrogenase / D-chiro-inositol 1-dehydrogenase
MNPTNGPTRRDFLKRSAAVAAGGALAGTLSVARSAHAAGDDTIRVALIGCGGRGTGAAANCLNVPDNVKLVAVADAFEDQARKAITHLKQKYGDRVDVPDDRVFVGLDSYKGAIAAGVDLVLLTTTPGFRPMQYKAAIEAGKHVFMEKPVCVDAGGYRTVMEANKLADEKNRKVVVGLQLRHDPKQIETLKRVHDGAIGTLTYLRAYRNCSGVWIRTRESLAERLGRKPTEMEYQVNNWYYFVWLSGDQIAEQHVHHLDMVNWAKDPKGDAHPVEANGMGGREVRNDARSIRQGHGPGAVGHIYDHQFVEYSYGDGLRLFSQNRHIPGCWRSSSNYAEGTEGYSDLTGKIFGKNAWKYDGRGINMTDQEHVDLVKAIRDDTPHNEGYYGANSSFTAVLGWMATYSGQIVKWDEAAEKGPALMPENPSWDTDPPVMPDENGSYEHAVAVPGVYKPY